MSIEQMLQTVLTQQAAIINHFNIPVEDNPERLVLLLDIAKNDLIRSASLKRKADNLKIPVQKVNGKNAVKQMYVAELLNTKRNTRD